MINRVNCQLTFRNNYNLGGLLIVSMMPTVSGNIRSFNLYEINAGSWTEDLPPCKNTGIGTMMNSVYREDGNRQPEHMWENRSFHFKCDDKTSMYGIFDGHDGAHLAKYALDIITAEVLLGQLQDKSLDEDIKQILKQAFYAVERNYVENIGGKLAEKTTLQMEIPENVTPYEAYQQNPVAMDKLNVINTELSCGSTAVVALIYENRLYVANVGDSRALLCRTDQDGVLRVIQLSQDHVLSNEDEVLRLNTIGISKEKIVKGLRLGNQEHTRCLGHYLVKGGYKEFEELVCATSEPVISEPEIAGGIPLDGSHRFLMLMSNALYRSVEEATGTQAVNKEIVQMVVEQFKSQSTLTGVAQAVVDRVGRVHHDFYMSRTGSDRNAINKIEDITLLIRNFNFPLPNAISPSGGLPSSFYSSFGKDCNGESGSTRDKSETNSEETSYISSSPPYNFRINRTVRPHVDFSAYYANIEKARKEGRIHDETDFLSVLDTGISINSRLPKDGDKTTDRG